MVATIAVIVLHVSAPILYRYGKISDVYWHIGNFYDGMVRFCVPIFFMLSGALLLSKDYKLSFYLKNRFWRIVPALIFWSLIYIFYDYFVEGGESFSLINFIKMVLINILYGSKYHLWFVYTLMGLYLFVPILRRWIKNSSDNEILYFLIIWFATIIYSVPYFSIYLPRITLINFSGYIGYLVLGYYLFNLTVIKKYIPIIFIAFGVGVTIYGTYFLTHRKNEFSDYFYGYLTPNVIVYSIGVFLILKQLVIKNKKIKSLVLFLSNQSFGIYLVHILVLTLLNEIGLSWKFANPIISIPVTSIICLLISSVAIHLLRKIRYGNYISG